MTKKKTNIVSTAWYNAYDFSHDINGNATSHYELWVDGKPIIRTKRRRQVGYSSYRHGDAEYELNVYYKKVFKQRLLYRIEDPMYHPWAFGDKDAHKARLDRANSNVVHCLVLDIPVVEWARTPEGVHRRLQGLLVPYINRRVEDALLKARAIVDAADTHGIEHMIGRVNEPSGTYTGLYLSDSILETAIMKAFKSTKVYQ